ncbi:uncharacterized protein LOC144059235 isoform X2 [Vanacampus margaritifer]
MDGWMDGTKRNIPGSLVSPSHTSIGRVFDVLEATWNTVLLSRDKVLHAYLHFEAITAHDYKFSCVNCGSFPPIVIMDLHKQTPCLFSMPVSDVEEVPEDYTGELNIEEFWDSISMEMIARGLILSNRKNPFTVPPSYHFWAPWIGRGTRNSNTVLNTEFLKVKSDIKITEDRIINELMKLEMNELRKRCNECRVDAKGSHFDLMLRIRTKMKNRQVYDKLVEKIWGASA